MLNRDNQARWPSLEYLEPRRLLASVNLLAAFGSTGDALSGPTCTLLADSAGNFYGTAGSGGSDSLGGIFELAAGSSTLTTLASFNINNGDTPDGGLVADSSGNLYGVAVSGGSNGAGDIFELVKGQSTITDLANFNNTNGANPEAGLIMDSSGNLFGVASGGGASSQGTVFELQNGTHSITVIATFSGEHGGNEPDGQLFMESSGNLYGTTADGGANGDGTVFEVAKYSGTATILASFNGTDGTAPQGGVIMDSVGDLFGAATGGGANRDGAIYELPANSSSITLLASFNGSDGSSPYFGSLLMDAAGDLFGTTHGGGGFGDGGVFELAAGATTITLLGPFEGFNGSTPDGGLIVDSAGNLYGTVGSGASADNGGVFEVTGSRYVTQVIGTLSNGVLTVNGTNDDDIITLTSDGTNVTATLNGTASQPFPLSSTTSITVNGLAGNDLITIEPSMPSTLGVSVQGGPGDDTITGGPGNDILGGGAGNDSISGGPGDDSIKGGAGDDTLAGGKGNDTLFGSLGNDVLRGGLGDDSLNGGAGTNQMYGGQGNNTFYAVNGTADQIFAGAATNDFLIYRASDSPIVESGAIPPGNTTLI
jgi:uncharacterized repeat protein (TIGR03803 family)